jgi:hypothetical protein
LGGDINDYFLQGDSIPISHLELACATGDLDVTHFEIKRVKNLILQPFLSSEDARFTGNTRDFCQAITTVAFVWEKYHKQKHTTISRYRLFFNCFPPKNWPSWGASHADPSQPPNKSRANSANDQMHVLTVPMTKRLLCSLDDELDQTKLGIHSLDV